jgi:hypothetical protein
MGRLGEAEMSEIVSSAPAAPVTSSAEAGAQARLKSLSPEAERALAEAAARRAALDAEIASRPQELGGRDGLEPARYGDWEIKGIACDF